MLTVAMMLALVIGLVIGVSADDGSEHTWLVTHADGTEEYLDGFHTPFSVAREGDRFTLLPEYIEVYGQAAYRLDCSITLDLGSSTIVYPDNTVTSQMLTFEKGRVTILSDGARVFLQDNVRSFIQVSSELYINGGDGRLTVYAPCAINCSSSAYAELKGVYFCKNSSNMRGLLCARGNSVINASDSVFCTFSSWKALYLTNSGRINLTDSMVVNFDGANGSIECDGSSSVLTVKGGSYLFGTPTLSSPSCLSIGRGVMTAFDPTPYIATHFAPISVDGSRSFALTAFEAPHVEREVILTQEGLYAVKTVGYLTEPTDACIWEIRGVNGALKGYSSDFDYPLLVAESGDTLILMRDIRVADSLAYTLNGSITLCLDGHTLEYSPSLGRIDASPLIHGEGEVELTLIADGRIIAMGHPVFGIAGADLTVLGNGGLIYADSLGERLGSVELDTVTAHFTADGVAISADSVSVLSSTLLADSADASLITAQESVTLSSSDIGCLGVAVSSPALIASDSSIYGSIISDRFVPDGDCSLSHITELYYDSLVLVPGSDSITLYRVTFDGEVYSTAEVTYATAYRVGSPSAFTETRQNDSLWQITDRKGDTVGYTSSFVYPFSRAYDGMCLTLLRSATVEEGAVCLLNCGLTVDLGKYSITYSPDSVGIPMLMLSGNGSLRFTCSKGGRILASGYTFLQSRGVSITAELDGGYLFADRIFDCSGGNLSLVGGYYSSSGSVRMIDADCPISVTSATVYCDSVADMLNSDGPLTVSNSSLVATVGRVGNIAELTLDGQSVIYGAFDTEALSAEDGAMISQIPAESGDGVFLTRPTDCDIAVYTPKGQGISAAKRSLTLGYVAYTSSVEPLIGFCLRGELIMRLYLDPILFSGLDHTLRVSCGGVLYTMDSEDGVAYTHSDGVEYLEFSYPYVFPENITEESTLTVTISGREMRYSFTVYDMLYRLLELPSLTDRQSLGIRAYLAYALAAFDKTEELSVLSENYGLPTDDWDLPLNKDLNSVLASASLDPANNRIILRPTRGYDCSVALTYGGCEYTVPTEDGVIYLPLCRLELGKPMTLRYTANGEEGELSFTVLDLWAIARERDGYSLELFNSYGAYILSLAE